MTTKIKTHTGRKERVAMTEQTKDTIARLVAGFSALILFALMVKLWPYFAIAFGFIAWIILLVWSIARLSKWI